MFKGDLRDSLRFSLQYLWKRAVRITEKPYIPQREILCMLVGKPCNIYRLQGNPIVIIGFSPQSVNIKGFPQNMHNLSL